MDARRKKSLCLLFFIHLIVLLRAEISNLRLCADPTCNEPISHASSLLRYMGNDKYSLRFPANAKIVVYSKSAGSVPHLWGGMFNDKRGYFPKDFVREYKILNSKLEHEVPTEQELELQSLKDNNTNTLQDGAGSFNSQEKLTSHPSPLEGDKVLNENGHDIQNDKQSTSEGGYPSFEESKDEKFVKIGVDKNSAVSKNPTDSESHNEATANVPDASLVLLSASDTSTSSVILQSSLSSSDYTRTSAFSQYPTSSVAAPEIHVSQVDSVTNTAIWFPEDERPSGTPSLKSTDEEKSKINTDHLSSDSGGTLVKASDKYIVVDGTQIFHDEGDTNSFALPATSMLDQNSVLADQSLKLQTSGLHESSPLMPVPSNPDISGTVSHTAQSEPSISLSPTLSLDDSRMPETDVSKHSETFENEGNEGDVNRSFKTRTLKSNDQSIAEETEKFQAAEGLEASRVDSSIKNGWFQDVKDFFILDDEAEGLQKTSDDAKPSNARSVEGGINSISDFEKKETVNLEGSSKNYNSENEKREHSQADNKQNVHSKEITQKTSDDDLNEARMASSSKSANSQKNNADDRFKDDLNYSGDVGGTDKNGINQDKAIPIKGSDSSGHSLTDEQNHNEEKSYYDNAVNENKNKMDVERSVENSDDKRNLLKNDVNDTKLVENLENSHVPRDPVVIPTVVHHDDPENLQNEIKRGMYSKGQGSPVESDVAHLSEGQESSPATKNFEAIRNNRGDGSSKDEDEPKNISGESTSQDVDFETNDSLLNNETLNHIESVDDSGIITSEQEAVEVLSPKNEKNFIEDEALLNVSFDPTLSDDSSGELPDSQPTGSESSLGLSDSQPTDSESSLGLSDSKPTDSESSLGLSDSQPTDSENDDRFDAYVEPFKVDPSKYQQQVTTEYMGDVESCEVNGFEGSCSSFDKTSDAIHSFETFNEDMSDTSNVLEPDDSSWILSLRIYLQAVIDFLPEPLQASLHDLEQVAVSPRVVVLVVIVGSFLLLVEALYLFIKRSYHQSLLVAKIGSLNLQLLTSKTEIDDLKSKLQTITNENWEGAYQEAQSSIEVLEAELKVFQSENDRLQEVTSTLQQQLEEQKEDISNLQLTTDASFQEKENLTKEIHKIRESYNLLEQQHNELKLQTEQLQITKDAVKQDCLDKDKQIEELKESNAVLLNEADAWNRSVNQLQSKINSDEKEIEALKESLSLKTKESEVLTECIAELKVVGGKIDDGENILSGDSNTEIIIQKLTDISRMKAELKEANNERELLQRQLESEKYARLSAEEKSDALKKNVELLQTEFDVANQERTDAQTKLEVLSNYFKEKELQLQKELGVHEAMRQQSQDSVVNVTQKMVLYEQETALYKSQIGSLKAEIENQERSYKTQLALQEKKAHENWLAARAAERKLEESRQEAATLRNKLTLLEQEKSSKSLSKPDLSNSSQQMFSSRNGDVSSPRLGLEDRSESMDLPTSSRSSLFKESLDPSRDPMFLPPDRPLPPPFISGIPPGPLLPPPPPPSLLPRLGDRMPLPLPPHFDLMRGPYPLIPPSGPIPPPLSPEHWISPIRRGSPPSFMNSSPRDRPPSPSSSSSSHRRPSTPPYEHHPSRNPGPNPPDANPQEMAFDRDARNRMHPSRFHDPPPLSPPHGHFPTPPRGPPGPRPFVKRDAYPSGRPG